MALFFREKKPDSKLLKSFAHDINSAKKAETEGIELIRKYLNRSTLSLTVPGR